MKTRLFFIILSMLPAGCIGSVRDQGRGESLDPEAAAERRYLERQYTDAVQAYVRRKTAEGGGMFLVDDLVRSKLWRLELARVQTHTVVSLEDGHFLSCVDFVEVGGTGELDLDFYAKREEGGWAVDELLIHRVNGKSRFTYDKAHKRIPAK